MAIQIARMAKVRLDIIHLKIADQQYWGQMGKIVQLIEDARDEEIDVQANVYPYTRGNNNLRSIVPPWAHEGGEQKMLQRLASSESRDRIIEDIENVEFEQVFKKETASSFNLKRFGKSALKTF